VSLAGAGVLTMVVGVATWLFARPALAGRKAARDAEPA
jgi:hypothetical protein